MFNKRNKEENKMKKTGRKTGALKILLITVLIFTLAFSMIACGSKDDDKATTGATKTGGTLTVGLAGSLSSLDVNEEAGILNYYVGALTQEGLVGLSNDGELVPGLAESYDAGDLSTWVFKLRKDAKFQDGSAVTAEDIVYSIERARDPEQSPGVAVYWPEYITKVEATADDEITISLDGPHSSFVWAVSNAGGLFVTPKAWAEGAGTIGSPTDLIVGSGPYKATEFEPGSHLTLEAVDTWWGGTPKYEKIVFDFYADENARQLAFTQGDIDFAIGISADQDSQWNSGGGTVEYLADRSYYGLTFDPNVAPFDDENVRKAVAYAVDKKSIVEGSILGGHAQVATAIPSPEQLAAAQDLDEANKTLADVTHYDFDLEKAKEALAASKSAKGFEFTLNYPDAYQQVGQASLAIAESLKELGITAKVEEQPLDNWLNEIGGGQGLGWMIYFPTTAEPAEITAWLLDASGEGANPANWTNEEVAELNAESLSVPIEEQVPPVVAGLNIAQGQAIYQPVWWGQGVNAFKKDVSYDDFTSYSLLSANWASRFTK
jgi:peptide/nickel transport system substrate-binding protein